MTATIDWIIPNVTYDAISPPLTSLDDVTRYSTIT